jgi:hypothetical protein
MSEENVELIRRITEALDRGDLDAAVAIADPTPEFEYQSPAPDALPGPDFVGGVHRGLRDWGGCWNRSGLNSMTSMSSSAS